MAKASLPTKCQLVYDNFSLTPEGVFVTIHVSVRYVSMLIESENVLKHILVHACVDQ